MKKKYIIRKNSIAYWCIKAWNSPLPTTIALGIMAGALAFSISYGSAPAKTEANFIPTYALEHYHKPLIAVVSEENSFVDKLSIEEIIDAEIENSEMGIEQRIINACKEKGVDFEIALGIARLETGHFTSAAYVKGNNIGGLSRNEVPIEYTTLDEGIEAFVNLLADYKAKGYDTVEAIGKRWCPVNYDNWVWLVNELKGI